jgi:hypothetical protein
MVQHAWVYCALCHDLLGLNLNRVTTHEASGDGGGPPKAKTYDLNAGDAFWSSHMGSAFQTVASDVDKELSEYRQAMEQINSGGKLDAADGAALKDTTRALASFVDTQLPELQAKKRLIDAHMNIATEMLGHIRARSVDSYYAVEEALMEGRGLSREDKATLPTLLAEGGGNVEDKLRLFLLLQLHPGSIPQAEVDAHEAALREAGVDMKAYEYLKRMSALASNAAASQRPAEGAGSSSSSGGKLMSNVMRLADAAGVGGMAGRVGSALAAGVKQLLPSRRATPVTRVVSSLMDNKGGADDEAYAYLDPKLAGGVDGGGAAGSGGGSSRSRNAFSHAMVFMVGPGNYLEYQTLHDTVATAAAGGAVALGGGRRVTYGCTEVASPAEMLAQLQTLGSS